VWWRRPPAGGAFRWIHEAQLGGQRQFYRDVFPKDRPRVVRRQAHVAPALATFAPTAPHRDQCRHPWAAQAVSGC
jgi:hypothetical protein